MFDVFRGLFKGPKVHYSIYLIIG